LIEVRILSSFTFVPDAMTVRHASGTFAPNRRSGQLVRGGFVPSDVISDSGEDRTSTDLPFRQLAQSLPVPCWISDAAGSIIWVNASWLAYTGMDVADIQREGLEGLHDPAVFPLVKERWLNARESTNPVEMVFPLRGRDGQLRPFHTQVAPLRDETGAVTRWFGTNTDMSRQSETEIRLKLAVDAAQLGVWDWDLATDRFVYSTRAREICGFPPDKVLTYDDIKRATHSEDYPWTSAQAQRALDPAKREQPSYTYRIVRPSGEVRWVVAHGLALFNGEGVEARALRYVGTLQDVTERYRLESELREKDAILRSVFDASQVFIGVGEVTDDGFLYLMMNKATAAFYGLPEGATEVHARDTALSPDEIASLRQLMLEISASGEPRTLEYPFTRGGETTGWYVGTYTPVPAGSSGRPRISFVVIDITERKRAAEHQALLMREVDHRAKNALAVVQSVVQLTRADTPEAFREAVIGRVASLARAHTLLAADRWTGADFHKLVSEELAPYCPEGSDRLTLNGPTYILDPAIAQSLALVIHELATNAAKHGALRAEGGYLARLMGSRRRSAAVIQLARGLYPENRTERAARLWVQTTPTSDHAAATRNLVDRLASKRPALHDLPSRCGHRPFPPSDAR
jgi:PAS domain S-box-containing protein